LCRVRAGALGASLPGLPVGTDPVLEPALHCGLIGQRLLVFDVDQVQVLVRPELVARADRGDVRQVMQRLNRGGPVGGAPASTCRYE